MIQLKQIKSLQPLTLIEELQRSGPLRELFLKSVRQIETVLETSSQIKELTSAIDLIDVLRNTQMLTDDLSQNKPHRQCGAGCASCCFTVAVDITTIEAIACAEYLEESYSTEQLDQIKIRLRKLTDRRREMTKEQQDHAKLRCGMIDDDGICMIYPVRPLICAGVYSFDREACESAANEKEDLNSFIPLDRPAKVTTMGYSAALQKALVSANLDGNLYELNSAILTAIEAENCLERFLHGEDIFASAICRDAHSPPRKKIA